MMTCTCGDISLLDVAHTKCKFYMPFYVDISTTTLAARARARARACACACACVCVFAKLDQFLPVRSHFDTKRPVNFFHIATLPSPTFGPLFAFHCPLFFTKNNNLECRDVLKTVTVTSDQKRLGHTLRTTKHKWSSGFIFTGSWSATHVLLSFVGNEMPRGWARISPYLYSAINVQCSYEKTK